MGVGLAGERVEVALAALPGHHAQHLALSGRRVVVGLRLELLGVEGGLPRGHLRAGLPPDRHLHVLGLLLLLLPLEVLRVGCLLRVAGAGVGGGPRVDWRVLRLQAGAGLAVVEGRVERHEVGDELLQVGLAVLPGRLGLVGRLLVVVEVVVEQVPLGSLGPGQLLAADAAPLVAARQATASQRATPTLKVVGASRVRVAVVDGQAACKQ